LEKMLQSLAKETKCDDNHKTPESMDVTQVMSRLMKIEEGSPHETEETETQRWQELYEGLEFIDDVHEGRRLEREKVIQARKLEMDFFKRMGVYEKVPKNMATGHKVITTRWVDTNKGDEANPDYRSRLVGREINTGVRPDLFSATPPLETLKLLISHCAQNQQEVNPVRLATIDIKRAYFYAKARRDVYVKIPDEDMEPGDENRVAKLRLSLWHARCSAKLGTRVWESLV